MSEWDAALRRLWVSDLDLADLERARQAPGLPSDALEMLETVGAPVLRILVQLFTSGKPVVHRFWATPQAAVHATPTADGSHLAATEPVLIPYVVAYLVGLRRRPDPPGREQIEASMSAYRAAEEGAANNRQLATVLRSRQMAWRVSALVPNGITPRARWLHVTDCGAVGLWRMTVDRPDPAGDRAVTLMPVRAVDVWTALTRELLR